MRYFKKLIAVFVFVFMCIKWIERCLFSPDGVSTMLSYTCLSKYCVHVPADAVCISFEKISVENCV